MKWPLVWRSTAERQVAEMRAAMLESMRLRAYEYQWNASRHAVRSRYRGHYEVRATAIREMMKRLEQEAR